MATNDTKLTLAGVNVTLELLDTPQGNKPVLDVIRDDHGDERGQAYLAKLLEKQFEWYGYTCPITEC